MAIRRLLLRSIQIGHCLLLLALSPLLVEVSQLLIELVERLHGLPLLPLAVHLRQFGVQGRERIRGVGLLDIEILLKVEARMHRVVERECAQVERI